MTSFLHKWVWPHMVTREHNCKQTSISDVDASEAVSEAGSNSLMCTESLLSCPHAQLNLTLPETQDQKQIL